MTNLLYHLRAILRFFPGFYHSLLKRTYLHGLVDNSPGSRAAERCHLLAAEGWWESVGSFAHGRKSRSLGSGAWSFSNQHREPRAFPLEMTAGESHSLTEPRHLLCLQAAK